MKILNLTTHLNVGGISHYLLSSGARLGQRGHAVSVVSSGGEMKEDFIKKGIVATDLPLRTKNEFHPKVFFAVEPLVRLIKNEKIEVIHAHTRVTQVLASLASRRSKVPFVSTAHGFYKPKLARKLFPCWGERVVAISPLVAEALQKDHGIPLKKIRIIQNAVEADALTARLSEKNVLSLKDAYGIPKDSIVIGAVGRLVRDKGHEFLIEAAALLRKESFSVSVLILGDGRERERLLEKVKSSGLQDHVKIIATDKDIANVLSVLDIFVHPATYREGFGLSIAEAMIAGKPVIASDIPAINTLIKDKESGFMVKPSDPEALKETIKSLIKDPELAKTTALRGRQMALGVCSMDRMVGELESLYKEVVKHG